MPEISCLRGAALVVGGAVLWSLMGLAIRSRSRRRRAISPRRR